MKMGNFITIASLLLAGGKHWTYVTLQIDFFHFTGSNYIYEYNKVLSSKLVIIGSVHKVMTC